MGQSPYGAAECHKPKAEIDDQQFARDHSRNSIGLRSDSKAEEGCLIDQQKNEKKMLTNSLARYCFPRHS